MVRSGAGAAVGSARIGAGVADGCTSAVVTEVEVRATDTLVQAVSMQTKVMVAARKMCFLYVS